MTTENQVIELLKIKNAHKIGSSAMTEIKYASDIDLEEFIYTSKSTIDILKNFQAKFEKAKDNPNIWITDFKCGVLAGGIPIRWTYDTIMQGYQFLNGHRKDFTVCLEQESIIKMDVIALINNVFVEFSENYYFEFPKHTTKIDKGDSLGAYLLIDMNKYFMEGNKFKGLKRLFAYYKHKKNTNNMNKLIYFFNSPVGKLNQQINSMKIILDIIDNTWRPVDITDVKNNLKLILPNLPLVSRKRLEHIISFNTLEAIKKKLNELVKILERKVEADVIKYIKTEKFNIT